MMNVIDINNEKSNEKDNHSSTYSSSNESENSNNDGSKEYDSNSDTSKQNQLSNNNYNDRNESDLDAPVETTNGNEESSHSINSKDNIRDSDNLVDTNDDISITDEKLKSSTIVKRLSGKKRKKTIINSQYKITSLPNKENLSESVDDDNNEITKPPRTKTIARKTQTFLIMNRIIWNRKKNLMILTNQNQLHLTDNPKMI